MRWKHQTATVPPRDVCLEFAEHSTSLSRAFLAPHEIAGNFLAGASEPTANFTQVPIASPESGFNWVEG
jgi:hypothetical protein